MSIEQIKTIQPTLKIASLKPVGDILSQSADQLAGKLISQAPEKLQQPLNDVKDATFNGLKYIREQRPFNSNNLHQQRTTFNGNQRKTTWQKIKGGLGKFWQFARKPVQSLIGMIPGAGGIINQGIDYLSGGNNNMKSLK
ncbi:Hypothetical_protein [Hexamita inflata]|uniref:Hypothetical_protein n=1 Tax=Hexamita inflata TaxID=28002 RepID=A0AA86RN90_9EUKA|nr:Hypothetical protein HINF_LOCUS65321 [Hexamita inflata]